MRPDSAVAPFTTVCLKREVQERTAWTPESEPWAAHVPNQDVAKQRGCHRQGRAEHPRNRRECLSIATDVSPSWEEAWVSDSHWILLAIWLPAAQLLED